MQTFIYRRWFAVFIREYAAEKLRLLGIAEELQRRHADYFLRRARRGG